MDNSATNNFYFLLAYIIFIFFLQIILFIIKYFLLILKRLILSYLKIVAIENDGPRQLMFSHGLLCAHLKLSKGESELSQDLDDSGFATLYAKDIQQDVQRKKNRKNSQSRI